MRKYNFYLSEQALFPLYACPECDRELTVVAYNTSSVWEEVNRLGQKVTWAPGHEDSQWAASSGDQQPWVELELWNRSSVTGQRSTSNNHFANICCNISTKANVTEA